MLFNNRTTYDRENELLEEEYRLISRQKELIKKKLEFLKEKILKSFPPNDVAIK